MEVLTRTKVNLAEDELVFAIYEPTTSCDLMTTATVTVFLSHKKHWNTEQNDVSYAYCRFVPTTRQF